MKIYLILLFICSALSQDYFNLEINETGESTLFIFESSITTLEEGDEIGIYDLNGVLDSSGNIGEILVGSGVWNNNQLEIIGIHSVDLSQFGGPILPGAIVGNNLEIKIWKSIEQIEYTPIFNIGAGSGQFDGIFSVISNISCSEQDSIDECGICNGPGAIYDCGCDDIAPGYCDCNNNVNDCSGVCGGNAYFDQCNTCDDDPSNDCELDCNGEWGGSTEIDECGVCGGLGAIYDCGCNDIPVGYCDCNNNIYDCAGICGGQEFIDSCGICGGDESQCENSQAVIGFYDLGGSILLNLNYANLSDDLCINDITISNQEGQNINSTIGSCINLLDIEGTIPIYIKNSVSISGFQIVFSGFEIVDFFGGVSEQENFLITNSSNSIIGFSLGQNFIEPSGIFLGCTDTTACNYNPNANEDNGLCDYPQQNYDCNGDCINFDCENICGGNSVFDECGICNGPGPTILCDDMSLVCNEDECQSDGGGDGGGGDDGNENNDCNENEILDCFDNCAPSNWLGDGNCDDSAVDFNCLELAYDMGDCSIDFTNHIMPIISANCTGYCHTGASAYDGGLNLESYSNMMQGGNSGPAIQPFYPDYSLLYLKLIGEAPGEQMPYGTSLQEPIEASINSIYYWIIQGAIGPDDNDDGGIGGCPGGIADCDGECVSESLLGDGNCDDGEMGEANFNCIQYVFDNTDCPVGVLEFGNITYSDGQGNLEILMNCEFPVSEFNIGFSGISVSGLNGGAASESNFNLSFTDSSIAGSSINSSLNIPANSGLLTIIEYTDISNNEICFENSNITTYNNISYEAVLGDCIQISSDLDAENIVPNETNIISIYPNPFNPKTTINFNISDSEYTEINIFDLNGRKIETVFKGFLSKGNYKKTWDASNQPSGIYIVQLKNSANKISSKILLAK